MNLSLVFIATITVLGLAGIGIYTLLITRNLIKVVVALQILVKGVMLALIAAGVHSNNLSLGQTLALSVIIADTIVAVIALALAVQVRRHFGSQDIKNLTTLRR